MNKEELLAKVKVISEKVDDNEEIMEILKEITDGYPEEREAENTFKEVDVFDKDGKRWQEKFVEMKQKYRDRFFSNIDESIQEQFEDINKDDESGEVSFEDIFKERESDYKER